LTLATFFRVSITTSETEKLEATKISE